MSWYRDPQLFIYSFTHVYRITKEFGINPVGSRDLATQGKLNFSEHLSLGDNKESDFRAYSATFPMTTRIFKLANCQGWVINWDSAKQTGTWSREQPNSPFWSLPGIAKQKSVAEQALEDKVSELEAKISSLQDKVNRDKVKKEAVDRRVFNLEAEISSLEEESKMVEKEKEDIEAENAILRAEVKKERDEKNALIDAIKRDDMLARFEALEKLVSDSTSKLVQCFSASSIEEPWVTVDAD